MYMLEPSYFQFYFFNHMESVMPKPVNSTLFQVPKEMPVCVALILIKNLVLFFFCVLSANSKQTLSL